eukprot:c42377_g1_i1 orf=54-212(+)
MYAASEMLQISICCMPTKKTNCVGKKDYLTYSEKAVQENLRVIEAYQGDAMG